MAFVLPCLPGCTFIPASSMPLRRPRSGSIVYRTVIRAVSSPPSPPSLSPPELSSVPAVTPPRVSISPSDPDLDPDLDPDPDDTSGPPLWPRLLLLVVAAIFGTNFPTVKFLQSGVDPLSASTAALARFSLAATALLPVVWLETRRFGSLPRDVLRRASLIGVPVFVGYFAQALSLDMTDAGKSAFLCSLAVIIVPLASRLLPGLSAVPDGDSAPRSPLAAWGAPVLAVVGVALLELTDASPPNAGDAWALVQAVAFALDYMMNERAAKEMSRFALSISAIQLSVVSALSAVWATADLSLSAHQFTLPLISQMFSSPANSLALLYAGLITTALTVVLSNTALSKVSAGELTVLLSTEPVWAAAIAALVLDERMGSGTFFGAVLILGACLINQAGNLPVQGIKKSAIWRTLSAPLAGVGASMSFVEEIFGRRKGPPSS